MSHITDVPVANVLSLSGKDVEKLSRSQFSLSVGVRQRSWNPSSQSLCARTHQLGGSCRAWC